MRIVSLAIAAALVSTATFAAPVELVHNGGFETLTNGAGQLDLDTTATGWDANTGYTFAFTPGSADTTGAYTSQFNGFLQLWGPHNGSNNGLPSTSASGGNYLALDGAFEVHPLTQTIAGLIAGHQYTVSFDWGGAQQYNFTGPTTEQFVVGFGAASQATAVLQNANHGFTGWQHELFTFTADGTSDVLSFLAVGTPTGVPPFSVLDGVSVQAVATPEPDELALLGLCTMGLIAVARRRK